MTTPEATREPTIDETLTLLRAAVATDLLARARHRWQHPTFTFGGSRCGCQGWAATIGDMLDLYIDDRATALRAALDEESQP